MVQEVTFCFEIHLGVHACAIETTFKVIHDHLLENNMTQ